MQHTRTPVAQVYIHAVVNRDFAVSVNYTHNSVVRLPIGTCPGFLHKPLSGVVGTTVVFFFVRIRLQTSLFASFWIQVRLQQSQHQEISCIGLLRCFFGFTAIPSQNPITPGRTPYYGSQNFTPYGYDTDQ